MARTPLAAFFNRPIMYPIRYNSYLIGYASSAEQEQDPISYPFDLRENAYENMELSRGEVRVLEAVAEYGIAIAFIAIIIWLHNISAQHVGEKKKGTISKWNGWKRESIGSLTTAIL
ncbi:hypothetical protein [Candidatus Nitrospira neomarina]|uniref:Uncharacterized protein n=1 Tax=Candidatus Nitrospira neomarina TaxID=3020899 RepID=A0AA96K1J9_9BACT|nr:hypothetical protein [Candidatus Nitrospira neomarina]WNM60749.1 hypothetical protein PQG83_13385 [Candidatus Nitrospira neomarina]